MTGTGSGPSRKDPSGDRASPIVEPLESRKLLSANLTPSFAALPAMLPAAGSDQVTIQFANSGSSVAREPVTIDLYASSDGSLGPDATLLTSIVKPIGVKAGKSVLLPLQFLSPATLPDGSYFLAATVSGPGMASSTIVSSGPVTIVPPFVDLTSQIVQLPGSAVETGRRLSRMTVDVTNQGNVTASGKVAIEVFISIDGQLDETATPVNVSLPRLVHIKPGGSAKLAVYFSALSDVDPGQYYLLARVNPGRGINDRDAANNLAVSAVPVQVVRAPHRRHGFECYLVVDDYYDPGSYIDTGGDVSAPPADTSGDTGTPTTGPTTDPTTEPTTPQGSDPSVDNPPADSTPDPTSNPTTAPTPSDGSSGDPSDGGSSDTGSSDSGSSDSGGSGDSSGDSTDDGS
jgi:hypothetical protein